MDELWLAHAVLDTDQYIHKAPNVMYFGILHSCKNLLLGLSILTAGTAIGDVNLRELTCHNIHWKTLQCYQLLSCHKTFHTTYSFKLNYMYCRQLP